MKEIRIHITTPTRFKLKISQKNKNDMIPPNIVIIGITTIAYLKTLKYLTYDRYALSESKKSTITGEFAEK